MGGIGTEPAPQTLEFSQCQDLFDTFASQLLTAGVQLGYVSAQLGHANVSVTAEHYARWCGGEETYRDPMVREEGEVPADFLARLSESHQSPTTWQIKGSEPATEERGTPRNRLVPRTGIEPALPCEN